MCRENLSQARQQPADVGPSANATLGVGQAGGQGGEVSEAEQRERDKQLGFARALSCPGALDELDISLQQDSDRPPGVSNPLPPPSHPPLSAPYIPRLSPQGNDNYMLDGFLNIFLRCSPFEE